jgi:hypothetical protein
MILACITHWYTSALFFAPLLGLAGWLKLAAWREHRRQPPETVPIGPQVAPGGRPAHGRRSLPSDAGLT